MTRMQNLGCKVATIGHKELWRQMLLTEPALFFSIFSGPYIYVITSRTRPKEHLGTRLTQTSDCDPKSEVYIVRCGCGRRTGLAAHPCSCAWHFLSLCTLTRTQRRVAYLQHRPPSGIHPSSPFLSARGTFVLSSQVSNKTLGKFA